MSEIIIMLKGIGYGLLIIILLAILIPLSFYLSKKRNTSDIYRHIESSILFILFLVWAHSWSNDEIFLTVFWAIAIFGFVFLHLMLWANPVKKVKEKKSSRQEKKA